METLEWDEITDPSGEYDIALRQGSSVSGEYTAEEIQKKVNEVGVGKMLEEVNSHFRKHIGGPAIGRTRVSGKPTLVPYEDIRKSL